MPFPVSSPRDLTRRMEALMEASIREARPDADPAAISRAVRSPRGMIAALIRTFVMGIYETHLHLRWWGQQYFPDTADAEHLERHASIWGVVRRPATPAIGRAEVSGAPGTIIPMGTVLSGDVAYIVDSTVTIGEAGTALLDLRAAEVGPSGNAAAYIALNVPTVIPITDQVAVVDDGGLVGGAAIEADNALLARLLVEIQTPAQGGAASDYPRWISNAFATSSVRVYGDWAGAGTVAIIVAMGSRLTPRPPSASEMEAIASLIERERPVTAHPVILPAILRPVDLTVEINPFDGPVRAAAEASVRTFFAAEAHIGGNLYLSRLSESISSAAGEYRHRLIAPAATIAVERQELAVPGTIRILEPPE
ncbi:baseplate J/gp47 family protein [Pararhodobacter sp.]|uniref:baseplate J/gp47 family protein n=1 Tax=Pararhodobacter sp. TaxID=2127056 RepID=UPI002AFED9D8|nr:baseplate J/gp47 family protein [Pararhodobacter sp.]